MPPAFPTVAGPSPIVLLHLGSALAALVLGAAILLRPKGRGAHRWMGWTWVALMATAALSSAFVGTGRMPNLAGFSPIHLLTLFVLWQQPRGVLAARRGEVALHRKTMRGLYIGGCVVAGLFTLAPGRLLGQWLWGAAGLLA